jgi:hypothetical protein
MKTETNQHHHHHSNGKSPVDYPNKMTNQTPCNHRTPPKYNVEYFDDKMVIVNGVQYQRVEEQKPQTLYEALYKKGTMNSSGCNNVVRIVKEWLPTKVFDDGSNYNVGWNDCLQKIEETLK